MNALKRQAVPFVTIGTDQNSRILDIHHTHREKIVSHLWKLPYPPALAFGQGVSAQGNADWTTPIAPFRIADGLYYVGSKDLASYLVVTPQGNILINSSLESSPALIRKSVEQLGFKYGDIKILLISHAHWDHDAGSARVIRRLVRNTW